ncbi:hypothetical protein BG842_04855 [Haladaptatus sp. W1]|uniref:AI-2E family transporter n=1 Tax=Haladaptatus sp. W1 TaxID=1897478 RepID=UPI0008499047|nr:AI-2E family transporter [Haladaptatus sp. W1]ODR81159.1 hypothetical protein BG842_04855 [Haladaptatus sp. W1]
MTEGDDLSSTTALRLLLLVVGTLTIVLVLPFFQAILFGGLMAYLVEPINDRLSRRWGATIGAVVTILITVVVVLVPLLLIVSVAVDQGAALAQGAELPTSQLSKRTFRVVRNTGDLSTLIEPLSGAIETVFGDSGEYCRDRRRYPAFVVET